MDISKAKQALEHKRYRVSYFESAKEAAEYLDHEIDKKIVGFGDSATLASMELFERLSAHNEVYDPQNCTSASNFIDIAKKCLTTQVYLTSCNALSENGEIVNLDGTGNRVAGSLFGHDKVYFVVGANKIVPTLEQAIWRTRNIAAPQNAKRLGIRTPCAKRGDRCYDCASPDRICNGLVIHLRKMNDTEAEVILINENLGY